MGKETSRRTAVIRIAAAVLLVLITAVVTSGVAYARYRTRINSASQISMEYAFAPDSIYLLADGRDENGDYTHAPVADGDGQHYLSPGDWTMISADRGVYQIKMLLSNVKQIGHPVQYSQKGYIEIFATAGIPGADDLIIQLNTEGGVFTASGTAVQEGSSIYEAYGPGWIYRFTNTSGEPITWDLPGGTPVTFPVEITVWGEFDTPGAFTVIATGIPSD
ncbi:MAG: hypothetical protein IJR90_00535 [Clostridia bacterium]|nr:hypothetical protein [Clostridia bacterium]